MMRARAAYIALPIFWGALLAYQVWRGVNDFRSFKEMNPDTGILDYLLSLHPGVWLGVLAAVGVAVIGTWWSRRPPRAERVAADDESKRLFNAARGE